jgi:DNA sulfur modification protein DndC
MLVGNLSSEYGNGSHKIIQCLRRLPNGPLIISAIHRILEAYQTDSRPWVVAYSGGKDSTALVKLVFQAMSRAEFPHKEVDVVYCDTGVEIPLASSLARRALEKLKTEVRVAGLPIRTSILEPPLRDRFFVKVIGRGYPPPTDKFRWCTDRLRINPVSRFLNDQQYANATVLLGVRAVESATRSLTLNENSTGDPYWRTQRGRSNRLLFTPILDFKLRDVWAANLLIHRPVSLMAEKVADLYADAGDECPTVRDSKGAPCGKARFGCWTCTVAKHGVTLRNLIKNGKQNLEPLLRYRLWLEEHRNDPKYRWRRRRNGQPGPGPMTLEWRRLALSNLLKAQSDSGFTLIAPLEIAAIHREWANE